VEGGEGQHGSSHRAGVGCAGMIRRGGSRTCSGSISSSAMPQRASAAQKRKYVRPGTSGSAVASAACTRSVLHALCSHGAFLYLRRFGQVLVYVLFGHHCHFLTTLAYVCGSDPAGFSLTSTSWPAGS